MLLVKQTHLLRRFGKWWWEGGVFWGSFPATLTSTPTNTNTPVVVDSVMITMNPETTTVDDGDIFTVAVVVDAGEIELDGAAAYLDFESTVLQVLHCWD